MNAASAFRKTSGAPKALTSGRGGALVAPIQVSTTFISGQAGTLDDGVPLLYRRQANPGHFEIEQRFAAMEGGAAALLFASGMAAVTTLLRTLEPGDELIVPRTVYWTLRVWLEEFADSHAFVVRWVDDCQAPLVRQAITPATRMIWVEVPANPSLRVAAIDELAKFKPKQACLVVDATCASPALLQPLALGADVVLHSLSKCVGGHNDLLGGAITTAREDALWKRTKTLRWILGNALSPFESHLLNRSLDTLALRMHKASASALAVARGLQGHRAVREVVYPGLPSHPDHAQALRQMPLGQGCLIGLFLQGGKTACTDLVNTVQVWRNATSFGGTSSLLEHRHATEFRVRQSSSDYVRLSVGLEDPQQLLQDLIQALDACAVDAAQPGQSVQAERAAAAPLATPVVA